MQFDLNGKCTYCGNIHLFKCPMVKEIEYHPNGAVKHVVFYTQNDYRTSGAYDKEHIEEFTRLT